uniref:Uncharacterized protein n=1 Tax=viral metagenome TaxID=1070528 RepID=A0A6C0EBC0_9ZZZZ
MENQFAVSQQQYTDFVRSHYKHYDIVDGSIKHGIRECEKHRKNHLEMNFDLRYSGLTEEVPYFVLQAILHSIYSAKNDWYEIDYVYLDRDGTNVRSRRDVNLSKDIFLHSVTIHVDKLKKYMYEESVSRH